MTTTSAVSIWSYEGRSSRLDYFVVLLITSILGAIAGAIMVRGGALGFFSGLFFAAALWFSMCACARRLHDLGHSGWWSFAVLVPLVNFLFGLYILFAPGQEHDNDHGPSPTSKSTPMQLLPAQSVSAPTSLAPSVDTHQATMSAVKAEVITPMPAASEATGAEPMEEFWAQALHECNSAAMKAGLWAKAFADAGGDERVAKATYIRLRAAQLQQQYVEKQEALKLAHDQELLAEQEKQKVREAEEQAMLAKMTEAKRAEALLPKAKCPACDSVIPLESEQCPKCTALFTADSQWSVKPLSKYEALMQQSADDEVTRLTRTKEEIASDNARQLIFLGIVALLAILMVIKHS